MRKQVAVIGLGRFGTSVALTLHDAGNEVLAIDIDEKRVQAISSKITHAVQADATDEAVLTELGIGEFQTVVVAMGSAIESSVLCTILLRKLGVPYVIARADHDLHGSILERIGANRVVYPEHEMGRRVAHGVELPGVQDYMPLAKGYGISKLMAHKYLIGSTLGELGFGPSGKAEIAVLLVQRGEDVLIAPDMGEKVEVGDELVLSGRDDALERQLSEVRKQHPEGDGETA